MAGTKGMVHYSQQIKQEAVKLFLGEGCTYKEIAEQLEIRKKDRIEIWVKEFRRVGIEAFTKSSGRPKKGLGTEKGELERLRMENALLKKLQSESRKDMLAKRDIGQSYSLGKNSK
jgi:transposase-like protein